MEFLGKAIIALLAGFFVFIIFSLIPIIKNVSIVIGILCFFAVGTYLLSKE